MGVESAYSVNALELATFLDQELSVLHVSGFLVPIEPHALHLVPVQQFGQVV